MIEIIALIYLVIHTGRKAKRKGQDVLKWRVLTVIAWLGAEFLGVMLGYFLLGFSQQTLPKLMLIGAMSAFGGYLLVKYNLDKHPDINEDIDKLGNNY